MTETDIQRALTRAFGLFDYRRFLVVPNASYGVGLHECDLLALTASGYAHEIEIKVSVADLRRDGQKWHHHQSQRVKCLWFAAPAEMREAMQEHVPPEAGIILINKCEGWPGWRQEIVRKPVIRRGARRFTDTERYDLARLGTIRYWTWAHKL